MRVCAPGHRTKVNSTCFCALEDASVEEGQSLLQDLVRRPPDSLRPARAEVDRPDLLDHDEASHQAGLWNAWGVRDPWPAAHPIQSAKDHSRVAAL